MGLTVELFVDVEVALGAESNAALGAFEAVRMHRDAALHAHEYALDEFSTRPTVHGRLLSRRPGGSGWGSGGRLDRAESRGHCLLGLLQTIRVSGRHVGVGVKAKGRVELRVHDLAHAAVFGWQHGVGDGEGGSGAIMALSDRSGLGLRAGVQGGGGDEGRRVRPGLRERRARALRRRMRVLMRLRVVMRLWVRCALGLRLRQDGDLRAPHGSAATLNLQERRDDVRMSVLIAQLVQHMPRNPPGSRFESRSRQAACIHVRFIDLMFELPST